MLIKRTATAGHEDRKQEETRKSHRVSPNVKWGHFFIAYGFQVGKWLPGSCRDIHPRCTRPKI